MKDTSLVETNSKFLKKGFQFILSFSYDFETFVPSAAKAVMTIFNFILH